MSLHDRPLLPARCSSSRSRRALALGVALACLLLMGDTARAYVRTRSQSGSPIFWRIPQLTLNVVRPSSAFSTDAQTFLSTVQRSAATWSHDAIPCGDVDLRVDPVLASTGTVANDGRPTVLVTEEGWTHQLAAIALTTVFLRNLPGDPEDGEILDADIEINGSNYTWADIPDNVTSIRDYANDEDLRNALVHEMGHLLGLWHNCRLTEKGVLPDDQGRPSPSCSDATGEMLLATMYPSTELAATDKRTLSDDELAAICAIYPHTYQLAGAGCALSAAPPSTEAPTHDAPLAGARDPGGVVDGALVMASLGAILLRRRRVG